MFDEEGALDRLEAFASLNGPAFYGLPPNEARIVLERRPNEGPGPLDVGDETILPFRAGERLEWRLGGS